MASMQTQVNEPTHVRTLTIANPAVIGELMALIEENYTHNVTLLKVVAN